MLLRLLIIFIMSAAPCLLSAQTEGAISCIDSCPAFGAPAASAPAPAASAVAPVASAAAPDSLKPAPDSLVAPHHTALRELGFEADGLLPRKHANDEFWNNVPADCHIDWRRHRKRPFLDFCMDLAHFFNTYDTTYVERNRYNFRAMAMNTNYFQIYRVAGRDEFTGARQIINLVPDRAIKVGPRAGWRWLVLGYTFALMPETGQKASELNFAAYNSRIGCDMNWQRSSGPFYLRRARGFDGLPDYSVKGTKVDGIEANTFAFNVYYVFNYRHFSYPAAYNACSVQLRSAGSWLLGASYDYQHFVFDPDAAEKAIQGVWLQQHPSATPPALIDPLRVHTVNYNRIGVNIGYGYNWVPAKGWLVSISASPSFGFKKQVGQDISKQMLVDNFRNFHVDAIFRAGVVYNRQRWFAGASAVSYLYDYRHRHYDLNNNVTYLKAYVGVQFLKRKKFRLDSDRSKW